MGDTKRRFDFDNDLEQIIAVETLNDKRNKLIAEGKDTLPVDKMLLKAIDAPEVRLGVFLKHRKNKVKMLNEAR